MDRILGPLDGFRIFGNRLARSLLGPVVWYSLSLGSVLAEVPSAQLHAVFPPGGKQGSTIDVVVSGTHLDSIAQLHFSHPGITATQNSERAEFSPTQLADPNRFTVTIAADVPVGEYDACAIGLFGISNPRRFVVSNQTEIIDSEAATTLEKAKEITIGTMISGRAAKNCAAYYKFHAKSGQRVLVDCFAYRIDSRMDATLTLLDSSGEEIVTSRDVNRRDPLIDFTAPADGEYIVKAYDYLYGGGDDYVFRLSVHHRPHIDFVFPPAGTPGSTGEHVVYGRNLPGSTVAEGIVVDGRPLEKLTVTIPIPDDATSRSTLAPRGHIEPVESGLDQFNYLLETSEGTSNPHSLGFATAPVVLEEEPANNDRTKPQKVTLPCEIAGQFYPRGDEDWYSFEGKKGEIYWIEAISQQIGQTADPYVLLQRVSVDDKGVETVTMLQELDDHQPKRFGNREPYFPTNTDDPLYRFQVPEDATYRILVRDLYNRSRNDPRLIYRLSIRQEQPDFRLFAVAETPSVNGGQVFLWNTLLRKNGTVPIRVFAFRRDGFNGPIEVSAEGLPTGVTAPPVTIPGGQQNAYLLLSGDDSVRAWAGTISITGKATIGEDEVIRNARSGGVVWGWIDSRIRGTFRSRVYREIALGVTTCEPAPAVVRIGEGKEWVMCLGGKLEIPISVECAPGLLDPLRLQPVNVSPGLSVRAGTIEKGVSDGKAEINIGNGAKPGTYTFSMKAETRLSYQRYPDAIDIATKEKEAIGHVALEMAEAAGQALLARQEAEQRFAEANKRLEEAKGAATEEQDALEATRASAETALNAAAAAAEKASEKASRAEAALAAAEEHAAHVLKLSEKVIMRYWVFSRPTTVKVIEPLVTLAEIKAPPPLKQREKIDIPITIHRLQDYQEAVEISIKLPEQLKDVQVAKLTIPAGQTEGTLRFEAAENATPGNHQIMLDTRFRYHEVELQSTSHFSLKVEPAATPENN